MYRYFFASLAAAMFFAPASGQAAVPTSCPPDLPATIARSITPERPPMAEISRQSGTATVRVDLSHTGALVGAHLIRSSGSVVLDKGALDAVKAFEFAPGSQSCTHIGGSYTIDVTYPD